MGIRKTLIIVIILIFVLLVIMFVIPFGIVVNDSLVMLTRFNEIRKEEGSFQDALIQAGTSRFQAIILTTITTVCGMIPLLTENSEQAQYLIPAALSLVGGELFATSITLFIIPVLLHIVYDIQSQSRKTF